MKKLYILYFAILLTGLFSQNSYSQNIGDLKGIYYQAVAVDEDGKEIVGMDIEGKPLYEKSIGVKFAITKELNGPVQYEEAHTITTDKYGLFSLIIGQGEQTGGTYNHLMEIPWIDADQFLKVEISINNDGNYRMVSYHQFMTIPYSFYTNDIADDAITTAKILDFTILNEDISTGAVDTRTILDYTIQNEDIDTGSVDTRTILNYTIQNEDIDAGSVDTRTILDHTILNEDIATGSVDTRTILDHTILNEDIATGSVDTRTILDGTILNEDIATGAIDSRTILDGTILNEDIATGAIDSRTILDESIINEDIATGAIDSRTILDESIINEDIATGAIDSRTILDGSILNEDIADGTIDLTSKITGILPVENGGTGLSGSVATDGQLLIGNGTNGDFDIANLTAGLGIVISNTPGGILISSTIEAGGVNTEETGIENIGDIDAGKSFVTQVPLLGVEPGDFVVASYSNPLDGCLISGYVLDFDEIEVVIYNANDTTRNLGEGTFKVLVIK